LDLRHDAAAGARPGAAAAPALTRTMLHSRILAHLTYSKL
jgi:hypothetical protein